MCPLKLVPQIPEGNLGYCGNGKAVLTKGQGPMKIVGGRDTLEKIDKE